MTRLALFRHRYSGQRPLCATSGRSSTVRSQMWPLRISVRATVGRHERSRKHNSYLSLLHSFLHAADAAVHCATHAPDSPQFCAQEKLFELQFDTHSATVWFCASRSLSIKVPALLAAISDRNNESTIMYLMLISSRQRAVRPVFRSPGSARPSARLWFAERPTRSRDPAQFQKSDMALTA
jgi:hypothetical protein